MSIRLGDTFLALLVLAITAMLVVPLPTVVIDVMIVVNLAISFLLLLVGLYMPSSLSLLSFPTLILLTTLFRLSLNVASSRLILSQADAGVVIHSFGTFLIRGELFVGIVIFTIVTIVNFIVIAKGATRVSEVSARFVLDALPGKQMSIDSDVRAGLIAPEEAKKKRDELRKESQLFGAMDGAMKFIQGDAIAGLCIIVTNIFGGLYLGLSRGQDISSAAHTYTILTVGDGLVSQIPALLISICAGIVVTRVSSGEGKTLGSDISEQLFSAPKTILLTGAILGFMGILPGVPFLPFFGVSLCFFITAYLMKRSSLISVAESGDQLLIHKSNKPLLAFEPEVSIDPLIMTYETLRLQLGSDCWKASSSQRERLHFWWSQIVDKYRAELGLVLPNLLVEQNKDSSHLGMNLSFNGSNITSEEYLYDKQFVNLHHSQANALGFEVVKKDSTPITNASGFWTYITPTMKRMTDQLGVELLDSLQFCLLSAVRFFLDNPSELISHEFIYDQLKLIERKHSGYLSEVLGKHFIPIPKLAQVCVGLVKERVSIKDISKIVESIGEFCSTNKISIHDDTDIQTSVLIDFVRLKLRRQIISRISNRNGSVVCAKIDSSITRLFEDLAVDEDRDTLEPQDERIPKLTSSFDRVVQSTIDKASSTVVLIVDSALRFKVATGLRMMGHSEIQVLSVAEVDSLIKKARVSIWTV